MRYKKYYSREGAPQTKCNQIDMSPDLVLPLKMRTILCEKFVMVIRYQLVVQRSFILLQ